MRKIWIVVEFDYGKLNGWKHFLTRKEAEKQADRWRKTNAGIVAVGPCYVEGEPDLKAMDADLAAAVRLRGEVS